MNAADLRNRQNGLAIREFRRKDGRKVGELARAVGLHPQALINIENGFRQASWEALARIARELRVPIKAITYERVPDDIPADDANGDAA
jgi:DNA-binding XRE family transcriptional regulator